MHRRKRPDKGLKVENGEFLNGNFVWIRMTYFQRVLGILLQHWSVVKIKFLVQVGELMGTEEVLEAGSYMDLKEGNVKKIITFFIRPPIPM